MDELPHVIHAVFPALQVAAGRSHPSLKAVARSACPEEEVFPLAYRQERLRLIHGKIGPPHDSLLQRKIEGSGLLLRQADSVLRITFEAHRLHFQLILARGQAFEAVASL